MCASVHVHLHFPIVYSLTTRRHRARSTPIPTPSRTNLKSDREVGQGVVRACDCMGGVVLWLGLAHWYTVVKQVQGNVMSCHVDSLEVRIIYVPKGNVRRDLLSQSVFLFAWDGDVQHNILVPRRDGWTTFLAFQSAFPFSSTNKQWSTILKDTANIWSDDMLHQC